MRQESGPIFVRNELPQPSSAVPFRLRPIIAANGPDPSVRLRQITPARLAVQAKASAGSGLIDLDEVGRALVQEPPARPAGTRERLVVASPAPLLPVVTRPVADASPQRGLLLTSLALLAILVGLLGFLAVS